MPLLLGRLYLLNGRCELEFPVPCGVPIHMIPVTDVADKGIKGRLPHGSLPYKIKRKDDFSCLPIYRARDVCSQNGGVCIRLRIYVFWFSISYNAVTSSVQQAWKIHFKVFLGVFHKNPFLRAFLHIEFILTHRHCTLTHCHFLFRPAGPSPMTAPRHHRQTVRNTLLTTRARFAFLSNTASDNGYCRKS